LRTAGFARFFNGDLAAVQQVAVATIPLPV
jgi:hypothetical protein